MRISLNWLREFIDIDVSVADLAHQLTMLGLEIEAIEQPGGEISGVVIGQILSIDKHPDADKLVVCRTQVGEGEPLQIVCGAKNMKAGDKVPTAVVGATLPGGFSIARRKMRGIESQGMMCSARELGLGDDHSGLMILDPEAPIGEDAVKFLGLDDTILEIEVTPNRGDWASMIGVARELSALYSRPYRVPEIVVNESAPAAATRSSVTIEAPDLCPRYLGRVLTDVKVGPSPAWLCQRLIAAGQRPINNIVDITNYVLLETGHPLHAFDMDKLAENRIVVRRAVDGEKIVTIDHETRTLTSDMLVIADAAQPVAMAGVMGGSDSEVGEGTTQVFLESAFFNPVSIRRTARAHGMQTEASQRFQRGADIEMAQYAIDRAAVLMQELAGGTLLEGCIDAYPQPPSEKEVTLRYARTGLLLGMVIPAEVQRAVLVKLGFALVTESPENCTVRVPSWRHDVSREADLIEEIARLYSYDNIEVSLPAVRQTETVFAPLDELVRNLRKFLSSKSLSEMLHWTFISNDDVVKAGLGDEYLNSVPLSNPLSEKYAVMRTTIIPSLLSAAALNLNRGNRSIAAFEAGPVYTDAPGETLPNQGLRLAVLLSGDAEESHWSQPARMADFYDLKGYLESIAELIGLSFELDGEAPATYDPSQSARIVANGAVLGHLGKISRQTMAHFDIEQPVYIMELDIQQAFALSSKTYARFAQPSAFPASLRDMAVVVDSETPARNIVETAMNTGGTLLKQARIFDIYTGKPIPAGKKSVALGLVFQSAERTLTDGDTQQAWDAILAALQDRYQAQLR